MNARGQTPTQELRAIAYMLDNAGIDYPEANATQSERVYKLIVERNELREALRKVQFEVANLMVDLK